MASRASDQFSSAGLRPFGVEEEYLLLDATSGCPSDLAAALLMATPEPPDQLCREFFSSEVETSTPVCEKAADALDSLTRCREKLGSASVGLGLVVAGTGVPPVGGEKEGTVSPGDRYAALASRVRRVGMHQYMAGTHVHVEVPSRDAGVEVMRRIARWMPLILAMSANSPMWDGASTGFASWRHIMNLRWPTSGYPPVFADAQEYTETVDRLIANGTLLDGGMVTWLVRLSDSYPTIEIRTPDAQLEAGDAVDIALVLRALVDEALSEWQSGTPEPTLIPGVLNAALWMAARDGLAGDLVDPVTGLAAPAMAAVEELARRLAARLEAADDLMRVEAYTQRLRSSGGPAARQLTRFRERGIAGVLELYRETF